jgi:hypothetical protein
VALLEKEFKSLSKGKDRNGKIEKGAMTRDADLLSLYLTAPFLAHLEGILGNLSACLLGF